MSSESFRQAVALLGSLDATELKELGGHVAAMHSVSGPASNSPHVAEAGLVVSSGANSAFPVLLYGALGNALSNETGATVAPYGIFLQRRAGKAYAAVVGAVGAVHARWFPTVTRSETAAACRIYARCLVEHVKESRRPVDWRNVCISLESFASVISGCFPGYSKQGMMSILLSTRASWESASHSPR